MLTRVKIGFAGVLIFFAFVFFSYLTHKDFFTRFDFDTTVRFQDNISRKFDDFFSLLSLTGAFEISTIVLISVLVLFMVINPRTKENRMQKNGELFIAPLVALVLYGILHILELYGKIFVDHLPPPHFLLRTKTLTEFPQFYVRTENSYPSGHAARAAFLTFLISIILWRSKKMSNKIKVIIFVSLAVYDFLMVLSRVYLGEHWTSDVIGGSLLGASLALLIAVFI